MVEGGCKETNFLAHILRDVFDVENQIIHFGDDSTDLLETMHSTEHGMETWGLTLTQESKSDTYRLWHPVNDTFYGYDFAKLIVSYNYDPPSGYWLSHKPEAAPKLIRLLQDGGYMMAVNPGEWADGFDETLRCPEIEAELRRYSMLAKEDVRVYQK